MADDINKKNAETKNKDDSKDVLSAGLTDEEKRNQAREKTGFEVGEEGHDTTGSGPVTMTGDLETPLPEDHEENPGPGAGGGVAE